MEARRATHPSADVLKAFGLGKLDDAAAEVVMRHLDLCEGCRKQVAALSGDDFLARLRQARGQSSTPAPSNTFSDSAVGRKPPLPPPSSQTAIPNLPAELAASPQYEVLKELGRGGMGVVYLARNKLMDRLEVLKVVNKALLDRPGAVERFLREIRSAAKLHHVNVVAAYSALQLGDLLAFAMEHVEGEDLAALVKSRGPLPVQHACYYVQQAALGLQHAFEKQMVHRDIKPQNLMLTREGKKHVVKVLDFGLAKVKSEKAEDTGLTGEGKMLGTPDYIAPEQTLDAARADVRADVYSLGCTLYFLLTGAAPFKGRSLYEILQAHHSMEARPLNLARPEVPEELAAVVRKMMAKDPAQRYQTPAEVAQALSVFVKQGAKGGAAPRSPELSAGAPEARPARPPAPSAVERKAGETAAPPVAWDTLTEGSITPAGPRRGGTVRKSRPPAVKPSKRMWFVGGGIATGLVFLGLLAVGAVIVFKLKTKDGTLVLENLPADAEVLVDGGTVTVKWGDGKTAEVRVAPGKKHRIQVRKEGFKVFGEEVEIDAGGQRAIRVKLERDARPVPPPVPVADGFVRLFNGKELTGWNVENGDARQWVVEGDAIVGRSANVQARSYLLSTREYADFTLRLEFMIDPGGNGGVVLRAFQGEKLPSGNGSFAHWHPLIKVTDPAKFLNETSGTTHWVKDDKEHCRPTEFIRLLPGKWYPMETTVRGDTCVAAIDGKQIFDLRADPRDGGAIIPALKRAKGRIGFQAHTGTVRFRKIEIKELGAPKAAQTAPGAAADDNGFVPLFNGKDLTAWEGLLKYWSVKDGALVGYTPQDPGHNTFLCSKKKYGDFELKFKARLKGGIGNSGVQIRSKVLDPEKYTVSGPQADMGQGYWGSLYGEQFGGMMKQSPPDLVKEVVKPADFNDYHIKCVGKHVTIKINGETMVDDDFPKMPDEGIIAWQLHKGFESMEVNFKDVRFKDLGQQAAAASEGFVQLFNGKDLTGWKVFGGGTGNWKVADGAIVSSGPVSHLFSERGDYKDFHLRVEARINDGGNSGLFFRTQFGPRFPKGYEAQINSTHGDPIKTGSLYPSFNSKLDHEQRDSMIVTGKLVKPNEWFTLEVIARDNHILIKVNGKTTVDFVDAGSFYTAGHIALQQHNPGTVAEFRKIEIKELSPPKKADAQPAPGAAPDDKGFVSLFNGKDKAGWKTQPGWEGDWHVENGALIWSSLARSELRTERDDYGDFHLRAELRISDRQYAQLFVPGRYTIALNSTNGNMRKTGSLFAPSRGWMIVSKSPPPARWFTLEVIAEGNHVVVKVNGKATANYAGPVQSFARGPITLAAAGHERGRRGFLEYRKIEIKELK